MARQRDSPGPRRANQKPGRLVKLLDKRYQTTGLIGFDVGTGSRIVRPELLRLLKRGTNTTADEQYALVA
jgi:hypothetical protein